MIEIPEKVVGFPLSTSVEMTPKQVLKAEHLATSLPFGTAIYLTDLGTDDADISVAAAARVRQLGFEPVPHIAVRRIQSHGQIDALLRRFVVEADVSDILVIGGGVDRPLGPFTSTIDFLQSGLCEKHSIRRIGVAGHPEGSPDIAPEEVERALKQKSAFAKSTAADLRVVTQFSFDAQAAIAWMESLTHAGFDLPIHLGVAGPAKITTLIKYAAMCGVGPSMNFLKKKSGMLTTLMTNYSPDAFVGPIEAWHDQVQPSNHGGNLAGLHIFPFGGLELSSNWLKTRGTFVDVGETQTLIANGAVLKGY